MPIIYKVTCIPGMELRLRRWSRPPRAFLPLQSGLYCVQEHAAGLAKGAVAFPGKDRARLEPWLKRTKDKPVGVVAAHTLKPHRHRIARRHHGASIAHKVERARDLMPIVVLTALAVAGRLIFTPVPAIKPIIAIVVMGGLCFGREEGFMIGALAMLVSNVFFGQGPWTPWQMFSMGLVGYLAGVMGSRGRLQQRWSVAVFGAAMALLHGFILDTWTIVGFVSNANTTSALATYAAGLVDNTANALGTVVFLVPIARSWPRIFGRIKERYLA